MRILLVEDAEDIADAIRVRLAKAGYAVDMAENGEAAEDLLATETYQLIVLDLMLGRGVDGQTILQRLRKRGDTTPVLVVTARSQVDCKINVLDIGADDYLVKPFHHKEFLARCRAMLRRNPTAVPPVIEIGQLAYDPATATLTAAGDTVALPPRERALAELLIRDAGRLVPRRRLETALSEYGGELTSNALDLAVSRLRKKLEAYPTGIEIATVRGLGYLMRIVDP